MPRAVSLNESVLQIVHIAVSPYMRDEMPDPNNKAAIEEMWLVLGTCDILLNEYARLGRMLWTSSHDAVAPAAWRANLPVHAQRMLHHLEVWIKVLKETYPLED